MAAGAEEMGASIREIASNAAEASATLTVAIADANPAVADDNVRFARAGERVRYSTGPEGAEYVAVCTPAFAPDTVHREDEA